MLKILYVIDTLEQGGAERSLLEIVSRMDHARFRPMVCQVYEGSALRAQFEAAGVQVQQLGIGAKYGFVTAVRRLTELVRQERPDLIHTSLFRASQIGRIAAWRTGTPVVSSWTNTPYSAARRQWDPSARSGKLYLLQLLDWQTAKLVTRFHSVSRAVADDNQAHLGVTSERVAVVYRGRDVVRLQAVASEDIARVRRELSLGEETPVLLNVGRLVPQKGQWALLQMMTDLRRDGVRAKLLIAGDGPLRCELAKSIAQQDLQDDVLLLGTRGDVPALLKASDAFVFPSHYEGLPGALIEAMLSGTPIVASDIPMHREFLDHEKTGLLVDASSPQDLAAAVKSLIQQPESTRRMAAAAQRKAERLFDIDDVVGQMEVLFAEAAEVGRRRCK